MAYKKILFNPKKFKHDPNTWYTQKGYFSTKECEDFIAIAETYPSKHSTMGYEKEEEEEADNSYSHRDSFINWVPQDLSVPILQKFWQKYEDVIVEANNKLWEFDLKCMYEQAQFTRYGVKGHFDYHMDLGKGQMCLRKVSVVTLLTDPSEFEGGDLQFYNGRSAKLEKGDTVVFPSYMLHRVTPITKGMRKSIVLWAGGIVCKKVKAFYNSIWIKQY